MELKQYTRTTPKTFPLRNFNCWASLWHRISSDSGIHPYQSWAFEWVISRCRGGLWVSHIIFNQSAASHNDSWWSATSCAIWALWSGLSSITLLAPCYPGWPWALILAWSVGTEPGIGGDHKCPPLPHLLQHMKVNRGHAGLIPAPDINFWSMAGASEGVFSNSAPLTSLRAPGDTPPPLHPTHRCTPPLSSHSKAWATPNVTDVSLPIVHGWPHLNGWLVPRPAPYNGLLSHSDLFWAFCPFSKERISLSLSLSGSLGPETLK